MVHVTNYGGEAARGLVLKTSPSNSLNTTGAVVLGDLSPGGTLSYTLSITPNLLMDSIKAQLPLLIYVVDSTMLHTASVKVDIPIALPPSSFTTKEEQSPILVWVYPNPDNFDRAEIRWTQEDITIQVKVISGKPINKRHFCLEINGQPCSAGVKFDEVRIQGDRGSWTIVQTVHLREGKNVLRAVWVDSLQKIYSEPITIHYSPARPTLHILAVGIPHTDLKYTTKDALDFTIALAHPNNAAFEQIFVDTLLREFNTTKTEIMKAFRRLQYRYDALQLLPEDILIVFISAHGLTSFDGRFRIAASDYDSPFLRETSLDFEHEILNYFQGLPCRKVFIVDACHSGRASAKTLASIIAQRSNLDMLVSCQPDEFSYEDDTWQNGAFTCAIVNAIQNFIRNPAHIDKNRDMALDLSELFGFIQQEVPALVEKKRPKPKTTQRPHLTLSHPAEPVVLFKLNKSQ